MPISLQESASYGDNSIEDEDPYTDLEEEALAKPPTSEQVFFLVQFIYVFLKSHNFHLITEMFVTSQTPEIEIFVLIMLFFLL